MSAINLNKNNFNEVILNADKPILIDFWATWCGPCRMQSPVIEELSEELQDSVIVAKVNVDENPDIASKFSVMSIPTLVLIKDGKFIGQRTGLSSKSALLSMLNSVSA